MARKRAKTGKKGNARKPAARKPAARKKAAKKAARKAPGARKKAPSKTSKASKRRAGSKAGGGSSSARDTVLPYFQVDAFTGRRFHGNPAGVVLLEKWLSDETMQAIAAENNLAETAFLIPAAGKAGGGAIRLGIRWFSPLVEVDLCGHATLASAHVLWEHVGFDSKAIVFDSRSGPLRVERDDGMIVMDFPSRPAARSTMKRALAKALGREPVEVLRGDNYVAVYDSKREVHDLSPDFGAIAALDAFGVIATAPGVGHDFVSRYFAPKAGINEDAATGSAHCTLAPYWAGRLGRNRLTAHQVSARGGELMCELDGDRVRLGGRAVTFLDGRIRF